MHGGEDVAPPRREQRRSRRLLGREEGEDVAEHAVLQLAQAVADAGGGLGLGAIHRAARFHGGPEDAAPLISLYIWSG